MGTERVPLLRVPRLPVGEDLSLSENLADALLTTRRNTIAILMRPASRLLLYTEARDKISDVEIQTSRGLVRVRTFDSIPILPHAGLVQDFLLIREEDGVLLGAMV